MDVFRLDKSTYFPDAMVEGYSSMIWTERYRDAGEFQMNIPNVAYARELIPEGSLISLRDSREVMLVETHTIDQDEEGIPELVITGRTFETFLENRDLSTTMKDSPADYFFLFMTPSEEIAYYLWNDVVSNGSNTPNGDWIPNVVASSSVTDDGPSGPHVPVTFGEKYAQVTKLLEDAGWGIRNIRPDSSNADLLSYDLEPTPMHTQATDVTQLRLDIYNGTDRSRDQSVVIPVVLSYDSGDITDPQYLLTLKDYKNVVIASTGVDVDPIRTYYAPGTPDSVSGLDRRVLTVDGSNVEFGSTISFEDAIKAFSLSELAKHNQKVLFGGEISPLAHYKYGSDYFLGDLVSLTAEYNFAQTMQVSEYVRTEDATGERGYPTLIVPS